MIPHVASPLVWSAAIGVGLLMGVRHAFEPDHLMAVATMVTRERRAGAALRLGASWGVGHTVSLLVVAALLSLARQSLPSGADLVLELAVAVMIFGLGLRALLEARRLAGPEPALSHQHGTLSHRHPAGAEHEHVGRFALARGPLAVGMVHGLAGSGALTAAAGAAFTTVPDLVTFVLLFGLGSTLGMAAVAGLAAWPLAHLVRSPRTMATLTGATGLAAVVFSVAWGSPLVAALLH